MVDLIDRQAAIQAMLELQKEDDDTYGCHIPEAFHGERAAKALKALPSAQPKPPTDDCISRQAAIDAADRADYTGLAVEDVKKVTDEVVKELKRLPSAQPERTDCTDCPEYDTERHSCPRYCDVIRKTLEEAKQERTGRWIHDGYAFKGGIDWMHCSECGHKDSWSAATRTPFCAWCGARMEDGEAE